jgi:hypothetical protein
MDGGERVSNVAQAPVNRAYVAWCPPLRSPSRFSNGRLCFSLRGLPLVCGKGVY